MPRAGSSFENLVVEHFQNYIKKGEISDVIKPFIDNYDDWGNNADIPDDEGED